MGLINIVALPNLPPKAPKQKVPSASTAIKSSRVKTIRKKVSETTTIYGEELFVESALRKESAIIVHFSVSNNMNLRFSDDGEFILGYGSLDRSKITLWHCLDPIILDQTTIEFRNFMPPLASDRILIIEFELPNNGNGMDFEDKQIFQLEKARDYIIGVIRNQLKENKEKKIEAQREADRTNFLLEQQRKEEFERQFGDEESRLTITETTSEVEPTIPAKKPIFFVRKTTVTETTETTSESSNNEIDVEEEKPQRKLFMLRKSNV